MSSNTTPDMRWPPELVFTTRAGAPLRSAGASSAVSRKWPRWFVANCISQPSAVRASGQAITPALLSRRWRTECSASQPFAKARTLSGRSSASERTSRDADGCAARIEAATDSAFFVSRAVSVTAAPRAASARDVSAPSPPEGPVTIATLPARSMPSSTWSAVDCESKRRAMTSPPVPRLYPASRNFTWRQSPRSGTARDSGSCAPGGIDMDERPRHFWSRRRVTLGAGLFALGAAGVAAAPSGLLAYARHGFGHFRQHGAPHAFGEEDVAFAVAWLLRDVDASEAQVAAVTEIAQRAAAELA